MQQFVYTSGKNATDSSLIIDAMDLLHGGQLDGFCLVSSDSDFTRLATRIRESGRVVYGFGEQKTPQAFVAACDKFVYTEILRPQQSTPVANGTTIEPLQPLLSSAVTASARTLAPLAKTAVTPVPSCSRRASPGRGRTLTGQVEVAGLTVDGQ